MNGLQRHEVCLTELDVVRIERLLQDVLRRMPAERPSVQVLEGRLDAAEIVHASCIEPDVVTMNSTVVLTDVATQEATTVVLASPQDADPERSRVSVLSPVGRALIGARIGDLLRVPVPGARVKEIVVSAIPYQPEANGRYDL